jgi:hypothetical protein
MDQPLKSRTLGNDYMPFPKYEEGVSMQFRDKEDWQITA